MDLEEALAKRVLASDCALPVGARPKLSIEFGSQIMSDTSTDGRQKTRGFRLVPMLLTLAIGAGLTLMVQFLGETKRPARDAEPGLVPVQLGAIDPEDEWI